MSFGGTKTLKVFIYTLLVFLISRKVFVHSEKTKKFLIWQSKIVYAELPEYDFSSSNPDFTMVGNEVLFFGRLDGNKGLELFSEIAPLLPDTIFRICGELVDTALESTLGILSKMDNVILNIGRVDQGSLPSIFQKAKCVVLPYSGATQSGIPFLARSLRTPVLVADVGDLAATVSDPMYGASILSRDPEVWSKVIDDTDWHHLRLCIDAVSGRDHVGGVYALVGKEIATGYIK
jgi:glycosyltransferase involved in cell wall biosynthesis